MEPQTDLARLQAPEPLSSGALEQVSILLIILTSSASASALALDLDLDSELEAEVDAERNKYLKESAATL